MNAPSRDDRVVRVAAYLTDEVFGHDHWRAAQFSAPARDKPGVLLLYDSEAERDAAIARAARAEQADAALTALRGEVKRLERDIRAVVYLQSFGWDDCRGRLSEWADDLAALLRDPAPPEDGSR